MRQDCLVHDVRRVRSQEKHTGKKQNPASVKNAPKPHRHGNRGQHETACVRRNKSHALAEARLLS